MSDENKKRADIGVPLQRLVMPAYGIIDPDYARVFTICRKLAHDEGYALMMHGSFTRDLDLIAVPWKEHACEPEHLVRRILACEPAGPVCSEDYPTNKEHGRLASVFLFKDFSDPRFIDFSVYPRARHNDEAERTAIAETARQLWI